MPDQAHIALGSNLGHREGHIAEAALRIDDLPGTRVEIISSLYETEPVGKTDQPRYVNAVLCVETDLEPPDLLVHLLAIERAMGRVRREAWGPRTIDLDLLLHGDHVISSDGLTLPHPRMGERHFVLVPLLEISPLAQNPATGRLWQEALDALPALPWGRRLEIGDD